MIDKLLSTRAYASASDRDRARIIYAGTIALIILFTLYALFVDEERTGGTAFESLTTDTTALLSLVSVYVLGAITLFATRQGWRTISGIGPAVMWYFSGVQIALQEGFANPANGISLIMLILLSGLFIRTPGIIVGYAVTLVTLFIGYGRGSGFGNSEYSIGELMTMVLQVTGVALTTYLLLRTTNQTRDEAIAQADEERLKLATLSTQIAQRISRRLALSDVLNTTVEQIRESYPAIYHVQIFLIDDSRRLARLVASTGEVGRLLLSREHSLDVGSQSVIGHVTATGEALIARSGDADNVHRRNEFLPDTVVEAAFPLRIGDNIIGALDLQSRHEDAILESETPILQSLADNIAIAIDNARLAEQTEQRLQENQRLLEQMRSAMTEVERLNQQLTLNAWTEYLSNRGDTLALALDLDAQQAHKNVEWTPTLAEAVQRNRFVQKQQGTQSAVAVPLRVRGQVIGAMEFELEDGLLTPEDVDLVQTVGERLGLALESARLYDESRRVAHREAMLNEIGSRLQSSNNVDGVLSAAARSLQSSLGAQRVAIRLGTPQTASAGQRGNGSS